jgi:hypothetical protein
MCGRRIVAVTGSNVSIYSFMGFRNKLGANLDVEMLKHSIGECPFTGRSFWCGLPNISCRLLAITEF